MRQVTITQAPPGRSAMYASLVDLGGDELLCAFRVSTLDGNDPWTNLDDEVVCLRSRDGGETWPEDTLRPIYGDPKQHDYIECPTPLLASGDVLLVFYQVSPDHDEDNATTWRTRLLTTRSSDRGHTWSAPQVLPTPIAAPACYGGIKRLRDGSLLLNHYGMVADAAPGLSAPALLRSRDEGQTWGEFAFIAYEAELAQGQGVRGINETSVAELGDGRLVAMSRTYKPDYPLYRSVSEDDGQTWRFGPTPLHGLCPALLDTTTDTGQELLVLAYHDRYLEHAACGGVYLTTSADAGGTWAEPRFVSGGAYPCLLPRRQGDIMLAYYTNSTHLQATFFRPEELLATSEQPL